MQSNESPADGLTPVDPSDDLTAPARGAFGERDRPTSQLPMQIGRYRIARRLDRMGRNRVYLARDPQRSLDVVLEALPAKLVDDEVLMSRIERDVRSLSGISHAGIVPIRSLERDGDLRFLTMVYVPGVSLADHLAAGGLPIDRSLEIGRRVAAAIEAAHDCGVCDLGITSRNVVVTSDEEIRVIPVLTQRVPTASGSTMTGTRNPRPIDQAGVRADVLAFGRLLFECLTAGPPGSPGDQAVDETVTPASPDDLVVAALPDETPPGVQTIIVRCLAPDPDRRPAAMSEVRRALEATVELRRVGDHLAETPAGARVASNLPHATTRFIGRESEMRDLNDLLDRTRLVTLTGVGGAGKTRLALEIGRERVARHPDGVWLVELGSLTDPDLVPQSAMTALGCRESRGKRPIATVVDFLREKHLLVVLDNCEHLVGAVAEFVVAVLGHAPNVRVLATSREVLGVTGETTYGVNPLPYPAMGRVLRDEQIASSPAVRLFVDRARLLDPRFELTDDSIGAVCEICRHLDGIPLALELAAARTRALPVHEIARRLDQRFRLLTRGHPGDLPHHRTLRGLIDWSYDHLEPGEQVLFRRLSVFAGGWTLAAAEAIAAGRADTRERVGSETTEAADVPTGNEDVIEPWEVLDLLARLIEKSLVETVAGGDADHGGVRYRMLETVREYAREQLEQSGETAAIRGRYRDHYLGWIEEAEIGLRGPEQAIWLSRLASDHENLRRALLASEVGQTEPGVALRAASRLHLYWELRGLWSEARSLLGQLLPGHPARTSDRAAALNTAGVMASRQADFETARDLYEEALSIRRELGNQRGVAASLNNLGLNASARSDHEAARAYFEDSVAKWSELGDRRGTIAPLSNLANLAMHLGEFAIAWKRHQECLAARREIGEPWGIADSLLNLGNVAIRRGEPLVAERLYLQSLEIRRRLGDRAGIAALLNNLGLVAFERGDDHAARRHYEESLAVKRELQDRVGVGITLSNLGDLACVTGDLTTARERYEEAVGIDRESGRQVLATSLTKLARATGLLGEPIAAQHLFDEALQIAEEAGDRPDMAVTLLGIAAMLACLDDSIRAARLLGAVDTLRHQMEAGLGRLERTELEVTTSRLRKALGPEQLATQRDAGRHLSLTQAVDLARGTGGLSHR